MGNNPDSPSVRKWTDAEIRHLFEAKEWGKSCQDIASLLGRSEEAVRRKAARHGVYFDRKSPLCKGKNSSASIYSEWRETECAKLCELWKSGDTRQEIADKLGRSVAAIDYMRVRLKLPGRRVKKGDPAALERLYKEGHTLQEIADMYGISKVRVHQSIKARAHSVPQRLTENEIAILEERHQDGCTSRCIANRLSRSHTTVRNYINFVGLDEVETDNDQLIADLVGHGLTLDQIAAKLELSLPAVRSAIRRLKRGGGNVA